MFHLYCGYLFQNSCTCDGGLLGSCSVISRTTGLPQSYAEARRVFERRTLLSILSCHCKTSFSARSCPTTKLANDHNMSTRTILPAAASKEISSLTPIVDSVQTIAAMRMPLISPGRDREKIFIRISLKLKFPLTLQSNLLSVNTLTLSGEREDYSSSRSLSISCLYTFKCSQKCGTVPRLRTAFFTNQLRDLEYKYAVYLSI